MRTRILFFLVLPLLSACHKEPLELRDQLPKNEFKVTGTTLLNGGQVDFDIVTKHVFPDSTLGLSFTKTVKGVQILTLSLLR